MTSRTACAIPVCLVLTTSSLAAEDAVHAAGKLIGRPYVWGAEGPYSFDCSGLTQYVYQKFGIDLPRRAIDQSRTGDSVGRRLERGDLLFFSTDARQTLVTHVGLYEGDGVMIEASKRYGRVRRDRLDDPYWTDRFMFARRVEAAQSTRQPDSRTNNRIPDTRRKGESSRAAVRVIERIAGELFKIPRR